MSNPGCMTGNSCADLAMSMFWHQERSGSDKHDHVQSWRGDCRVWELSKNIRSGQDKWFAEVLDQCRMGALTPDNYSFLHGLPTGCQITFWYHRRTEDSRWHDSVQCSLGSPCPDCLVERSRRNRLLDMEAEPEKAAAKIAEARFQRCILITSFNKAVFQFSIHRAQTFAASIGASLFWMQAVDKPPAWFASTFGDDEIRTMKQRWLQYHARKTEGILSLCPCCP